MADPWRFRPSFTPFPPPPYAAPHPPPPPFSRHPFPPDPWNPSPSFHPPTRYDIPERYEIPDRDGFAKRMRLEPRYDVSPSRMVADAERRLNLIREHGQQSVQGQDGNFLPNSQFDIRDHSFDRPGLVPESLVSHQSYGVTGNEPFRIQERREVFDTGSSGVYGPRFSDPHYNARSHQFDRLSQMPQEHRHVDLSWGYRHDNAENAESYVDHGRSGYVHGDPDAVHLLQGFRHGHHDENLENFSVRSGQGYSLDKPAECLDNYAGQARQGYRMGDTVENVENNPAYPRGCRQGEFANLKSYTAQQSYRHDNPIESAEKYQVSAHEERPFYNSRSSQDYYNTSEYAREGHFQEYHDSGRGEIQGNENSPFLNPKQPYSRMHGDQMLLNGVNHELGIKNMVPDMRGNLDNRFEPHRQHTAVVQTAIHNFRHMEFDFPPLTAVEQCVGNGSNKQGNCLPLPAEQYPPLPPEPFPAAHPEPPPLPAEPPMPNLAAARTLATISDRPLAYTSSGVHSSFETDISRKLPVNASTGIVTKGLPLIHQTPPKLYREDIGQTFPSKHAFTDTVTTVDAVHLFREPYRASRPDHFVVILRGLPGSGKSYLAKALRDTEVENGGSAPRIHAMDDYFMTEVEKAEDNDGSKSSRGRKQIMKKVIEYCYEPEMEEAYRSSMLKAFKKTLDEGVFTFVIVDDRNLRVADFAQFWATAKRSGYEVYLMEAAYKDPAGCAARNIHGFTVADIHKMVEKWEEAPPFYLQLDIQSLLHGDDLNEQSIQEVDMDTDDASLDGDDSHRMQDEEILQISRPNASDDACDSGLVKVGDRWATEDEEELVGVKELHKSKWSKEPDEGSDSPDDAERNPNALSGLIQAYGKTGKSVHWGDRVNKRGFSIGAVKKTNISALIIGPGAGYNFSSNPIKEEEGVIVDTGGRGNANDSKRRFHEQLRAERDSFKAVFDRRRHRLGVLDVEDE